MRLSSRGTPSAGTCTTTPTETPYTRPRSTRDFYAQSVPIFRKTTVQVEDADLLPTGCVTAKVLMALAVKLNKLEQWHRTIAGKPDGAPCLRLIQGSRDGRITALVQSGNMTLKLALKRGTGEDEWVVLGDALKVSD